MNRRIHCLAMVILAAVVTGCGDSPRTVLRDYLTCWNELADIASRIPDDPETAEDVAGELLKRDLELLKKKMEKVKKRFERYGVGATFTKEEIKALGEALIDLKDEARFSIARVSGEFGGGALKDPDPAQPRFVHLKGRLNQIIAKLRASGKNTANLDSVISLVDQFDITIPAAFAPKSAGTGLPGAPPPKVQVSKAAKYLAWWAFPGGSKGGGMPGGGGFPVGGPPGGFPKMPQGGGPGGFPGGGPPGGFPKMKGP